MDNKQFENMWKTFHSYLDENIESISQILMSNAHEHSAMDAFKHMSSIITLWGNDDNFKLWTLSKEAGSKLIAEIAACIKDTIYINAHMLKMYREIPIKQIHDKDKVQSFLTLDIEDNLSIVQAYKWLKDQSFEILVEKAKEYSVDTDRFHNFKKASRYFGYSPQFFCVMFMIKHIVSLSDILDGTIFPNFNIYVSKIVDIYNYLLLLIGIIVTNCDMAEEEYTELFKNILS